MLIYLSAWGQDLYLYNKVHVTKHFILYTYRFFLEIELPNEQARLEILKIHAAPIAKHGEIGKKKKFTIIHFIFIAY